MNELDTGRIERGHVCDHGVRWPHPCQPCDDAAWEQEQARHSSGAALPAIGLSGFAQSGKTEAAKYLEAAYGYRRQHIIEPARRMLYSLLSEYDYSHDDIADILTGSRKDGWIIPELGCTSRHLQLTIGTEWMRDRVDPAGWASLWAYQGNRDGGAPMNDSVRFPNEETATRAVNDGFTILIRRYGRGPAAFKWKRLGPWLYRWFGSMRGVHDSERVDRLQPDYLVVNDGTLNDLYRKLDIIMECEEHRRLNELPRMPFVRPIVIGLP